MNELAYAVDRIYSTLGGDPDLGELVEMFVDEMPERVDRLTTTWRQRDWENLGRAAHQLKGAAGSYGFDDLTPALRALEHAVRNSQPEEVIEAALLEVTQLCSRAEAGVPPAVS